MAKSSKEISEEKTAASSYILTFYNNVVYLSHNFATYESVILELKTKHTEGIDESTELDNEEKKEVLQNAQNVRYYVHRTYIDYKTIFKGLNQKDKEGKEKKFPKEITELWEKIKEQFIVNKDDLVKYVFLMNDALQVDIMKELLVKSSDIVEEIYGEQKESGNAEEAQ